MAQVTDGAGAWLRFLHLPVMVAMTVGVNLPVFLPRARDGLSGTMLELFASGMASAALAMAFLVTGTLLAVVMAVRRPRHAGLPLVMAGMAVFGIIVLTLRPEMPDSPGLDAGGYVIFGACCTELVVGLAHAFSIFREMEARQRLGG